MRPSRTPVEHMPHCREMFALWSFGPPSLQRDWPPWLFASLLREVRIAGRILKGQKRLAPVFALLFPDPSIMLSMRRAVAMSHSTSSATTGVRIVLTRESP